jgi:hypothetical protein
MKPTVKLIIGFLTMSSIVVVLSSTGDVSELKSANSDAHGMLSENDPVALNFEVRLLAVDSNEACEIADYNNDGILDISAGRNWYAGPDYVPRPLRNIAEFLKDYLENNGEHAIDMDGDGWLDILSGSFIPTEVSWYKNPGEKGLALGKIWKRHLLRETVSRNEITFLHDFNGDNTLEYVANSWDNDSEQLIWKLQSEGSNYSMQKCTVGSKNGHGIGFGDINGDNREDILFANGWYERPAGDPLAQEWTLHQDWNWKHSSCPMIVSDLNGDGMNDVIRGSGHDYGVFWMEQLPMKEGKTQWKQHTIDDSWSQAHALAWVDLDGDGSKDLITGKRVRAHSGKDPGADEPPSIYYYTWNKETKTFARRTIAEGVGTGLFIGKSGTYLLLNQ